jgi:hypothetical protein
MKLGNGIIKLNYFLIIFGRRFAKQRLELAWFCGGKSISSCVGRDRWGGNFRALGWVGWVGAWSRAAQTMSGKKTKKAEHKQKQIREESWGVDINAKLPKYNALTDPNLRHHFESRKIQSHLLKSGLIDYQGRVIDIDASKSKLAVIEREFTNAEKAEFQRMRDEAEMRRRVQKKRHEALEVSRRAEMIAKVHEDRKIRREILKIQKDQVYTPPPASAGATTKKPSQARSTSASTNHRHPSAKVGTACSCALPSLRVRSPSELHSAPPRASRMFTPRCVPSSTHPFGPSSHVVVAFAVTLVVGFVEFRAPSFFFVSAAAAPGAVGAQQQPAVGASVGVVEPTRRPR